MKCPSTTSTSSQFINILDDFFFHLINIGPVIPKSFSAQLTQIDPIQLTPSKVSKNNIIVANVQLQENRKTILSILLSVLCISELP